MLVDDEREFIEILTQRVRKPGELTIKAVASSKEALVMLEDKNADVAFVDFAMPRTNGIETLKQIIEKKDRTSRSLCSPGKALYKVALKR